MARLSRMTDSSDEELPDLSTILAKRAVFAPKERACPPESTNTLNPSKHNHSSTESERWNRKSSQEGKTGRPKQRPLKVAHVDSIHLSLTDQGQLSPEARREPNSVAQKYGKRPLEQDLLASVVACSSDLEYGSSDHMSDFIVSDSDSNDNGETSRDPTRRLVPSYTQYHLQPNDVCSSSRPSPKGRGIRSWKNPQNILHNDDVAVRQDKSQARKGSQVHGLGKASCIVTGKMGDTFEEPNSILKLSPPVNRAVTPPRSPTKLKLPSPAKNLRIPPSPHRPSVDAFWSQEVINDWNDQYSPKKTSKSSCAEKVNALDDDDEGYLSPSRIRNRSPSKSPCKKDKQAGERRKVFNEKKYDLAASFLKELDQEIMNGQIADLTEATGGVHLVWSKKLQSTAGRANWKREAVRRKDEEGKVFMATRYRHHASIELAEKVIDDEDRLINVIAHEYCHLLNFMISNIKDNPHGKEFKAWARKCSAAFAHRGVNVTTTHVYEISYKYIWACGKCATEYKRHSKSIDPARHSCGKCHEKLVQIQPVPRGEGKGMSGDQKF
ncbi:MAG: hypothetical protein Q9224_006368, partial [Gallowayella concinna]